MTSTPFIKPIPIRVFNSNSLAFITSVGIHALLGLLLPNLTNSNPSQKSASDRRDVEIIELTSAEIARLPDQLPSLNMPNFSETPLTDIPVLDSSSLKSSVPNTFNTLPAPPALPALPALPPLSSIPKPPSKLQRSLPITPSPGLSSRLPALPQDNSILDNPQPSTSQFPPIFKKPDFGPLKTPVPIDQLINKSRGDRPDVSPPQKPLTPNSRLSQTAPHAEQSRKDKLISDLVRETIEGANNLRYNKNHTTNEDARRNDARWMAQIGTPVNKKENWQILRGSYPKAACLRHLEGEAIYGITVNPEGNVAKNPYLIKSSGYGILNQQAFNQIKSTNFGTDGQLQHYRVRISFNFDPKICPAVTQSQQNQQEKPTTPETPVESPKPTIDEKPEPKIQGVSTPETPVESPKPTIDEKPEPKIQGVSTPETPVESPKPTIDEKPEPKIQGVSTPETPVESPKPTIDEKPEPKIQGVSTPETPVESPRRTTPTSGKNSLPSPPSTKK